MSLLTAKLALKKQIEHGQPQPIANPTKLAIDAIGVRPEVFQHRMPLEHHSRYHVRELAKALRGGHPLTPITVFWAGTEWLCIDGHHRLKAYRSSAWKKSVPVFAFTGTLDQAINRAAKNSYDKLAMNRGEKLNAAWRLTIATESSKAHVVQNTGVSDGTVAHMRRVFSSLQEQAPSRDLSELFWEQARKEHCGEEPGEIDWDEHRRDEAQKLANAIVKAIGKRGQKRLEAFADALEIYDPRLPAFLLEHWRGYLSDDFPAHPNDDEF